MIKMQIYVKCNVSKMPPLFGRKINNLNCSVTWFTSMHVLQYVRVLFFSSPYGGYQTQIIGTGLGTTKKCLRETEKHIASRNQYIPSSFCTELVRTWYTSVHTYHITTIGVRTGATEGLCAASATYFGPIDWSVGRSGQFII